MGNGTDKLKNHRTRDILAYCQNFLGQTERAELEGHMRECAACQRTLARVPRFLVALNEALSLPEAAEMRAEAVRGARLRSRIRLAAALSALVVLGAGAIFAVT